MRKVLAWILAAALLLSGCADRKNNPNVLAAKIRAEYLSLENWQSDVELSAEVGGRLFDFTVAAQWERKGDTVLTLKKPTLLAGITARIRDGEAILEYDGAGISIGTLDNSALTPIASIPMVMELLVSALMARCSWVGEGEQRELEVLLRDPRAEEGKGTECLLYFDPETHVVLRGEVSVDGVTRLYLRFLDFTAKVSGNGIKSDAYLGGDRSGESGT